MRLCVGWGSLAVAVAHVGCRTAWEPPLRYVGLLRAVALQDLVLVVPFPPCFGRVRAVASVSWRDFISLLPSSPARHVRIRVVPR